VHSHDLQLLAAKGIGEEADPIHAVHGDESIQLEGVDQLTLASDLGTAPDSLKGCQLPLEIASVNRSHFGHGSSLVTVNPDRRYPCSPVVRRRLAVLLITGRTSHDRHRVGSDDDLGVRGGVRGR
jgi:hypothetical protein